MDKYDDDWENWLPALTEDQLAKLHRLAEQEKVSPRQVCARLIRAALDDMPPRREGLPHT